jgi:hypothetical protein
MFLKALAAVLLAIALSSGCAAPPAPDQARRYPVPAGRSLILFQRDAQLGGSANAYAIKVDGVDAAELLVGGAATHVVAPGPVTVEAQTAPNILNLGLGLLLMNRPTLTFTAEEGRVHVVEVSSDALRGGPTLSLGQSTEGAPAGAGVAPPAGSSETMLVVSLPPERDRPSAGGGDRRAILWRGVRDERPDSARIGRRTAAFGVSMGAVRSDPPAAEVVADVVSRVLSDKGLQPVETGAGPGLEVVLREFWFETDTTPLYWDVNGRVRLTLRLTGDGAERAEDAACAATGRTYAWPDADVFREVIRRCLDELADDLRGSALLDRAAL